MAGLRLTALLPVPARAFAAAVQDTLAAAGLTVHACAPCAEDRGVQCVIEGDAARARAALHAVWPGALDLCVREQTQPRIFVADMDATMVREECLDELAYLAGAGALVAELTAAAMSGGMDFATALKERIALLAEAGVDQRLIQRTLLERIHLQPGARTLVATLRAHGVRCVLVSGGFEDFVAPVAQELGFHAWHCNRFRFVGERIAALSGPIIGREAKLAVLQAECAVEGLTAALAIGDGANDIPMLRAAGSGIAFHAKPAVEAVVPDRITHGDLTTVLHFLGIPGRAWVTPPGGESLAN